MGKRLEGRTAVITAAGQGIGRAAAALFKREGATVFAADLVEEKLSDLDCDGRFVFDVRDGEAIRRMAESTGPVDILLNGTGYAPQGTILDADDEMYDRTFDINVKSMHRTMLAYLPGMIEKGRGSIINIASVVSSVKGAPERYVYAGTKGAVIGLTKAIAVDFARNGIRANAICPGTILTPTLRERMAETAAAKSLSIDDAEQLYVERQAMGRLGTPEEIAALALYLASDESSFTTGQVHIIDGGWSA